VRNRLFASRILLRARDALTPDGMTVLLIPLPTWNEYELRGWIRRVARVSGGRFIWTCVAVEDEPLLVIVFGREGAWLDRWRRWAGHVDHPADELLERFDTGVR
jgi:hypothetical protein